MNPIAILTALNGYKTYVGVAGMVLVSVGGGMLGIADPAHPHALDANTAQQLLFDAFAVLTGIGIGHKVIKADKTRR